VSAFLFTLSARPARSATLLDTGDLRGAHGDMWLMRHNACKSFESVCRGAPPDFRGAVDAICVCEMCCTRLLLRPSPPSSREHVHFREGHIIGNGYTWPRALYVHVDRIAAWEACAGVCGKTQQQQGSTRLKLEFWGHFLCLLPFSTCSASEGPGLFCSFELPLVSQVPLPHVFGHVYGLRMGCFILVCPIHGALPVGPSRMQLQVANAGFFGWGCMPFLLLRMHSVC
jgi:hypothetical protein